MFVGRIPSNTPNNYGRFHVVTKIITKCAELMDHKNLASVDVQHCADVCDVESYAGRRPLLPVTDAVLQLRNGADNCTCWH